jgi:hypothetical protein
MTTYVPDPTSVTMGAAPVVLLNVSTDLSGSLMDITLMCDKDAVMSVQYDVYGDGNLWLTQGSHNLSEKPLKVKYMGKGKTRIYAIKNSTLSTVTASCKIETSSFTGYCTIDDVRSQSGLTTDDISDSDLLGIIQLSTSQLNKDVNKIRIEERVESIDSYRENNIDGSNTVYYIQNGYTWFLADLDGDGTVGTSDVHVYGYSGQTRTELTVSSIDASRGMGKVTLSSAPSGLDKMTITYSMSPVHYQDPLLKQACIQLSTALSYTGIEAKDFSRISLGRLSLMRQPNIGFMNYMQRYKETVHQIKSRIMGKSEGPELTRNLDPISRKAGVGEAGR